MRGAVVSSKHTRLTFKQFESNIIERWKGISLLPTGNARSSRKFTRYTDHRVIGSPLGIRLWAFFVYSAFVS